MTILTPELGTQSPTSRNLPRWGYVVLALVCASMGVWASYVTLEYFKHGAMALESDKSLQELATFAALMFVASEMGAFLIAAMMTERDLRARRWALTLFAFAVLGLEVCTIVAVQLALTTGADNHQLDVRQAEIDLRSRIAAIESDAAITRDTGATQSMAARSIKDAASRAWAMQQAAKTVGKASSNNAALNDLHNQLSGTHAERMYSVAMTPETNGASALLKKLQAGEWKSGLFTPREIVKKNWSGLTTPDAVRKAAQLLEEYGWIACQTSSPSSKGGRPSERYQLHPTLKA
ncbi:MAG: hypothetical protein RIR79_2037 [Pseudomonadota bacterium]